LTHALILTIMFGLCQRGTRFIGHFREDVLEGCVIAYISEGGNRLSVTYLAKTVLYERRLCLVQFPHMDCGTHQRVGGLWFLFIVCMRSYAQFQ